MAVKIDWMKLRIHTRIIREEAKRAMETILQGYKPTEEEKEIFEGAPRQIANIADVLFKIAGYFSLAMLHQDLSCPAYQLALDAMVKGNEIFSEASVCVDGTLLNAVVLKILDEYNISGPAFLG